MSKIRAFCHVFGKNRNHAGFQVRAVVRMMDDHIYFLRPCQVFIAVKINFFLHGTPPNRHYEYLGANILLMRLTVSNAIKLADKKGLAQGDEYPEWQDRI